jgi:hypothetical protein
MARGRKKVVGECHLCGHQARLSFEHVPPAAAFNDRAVVRLSGERVLREHRRGKPRGPTEQRGVGSHTLCRRCNSRTGSWYGLALSSWCRQGAAVLEETHGTPTLAYPYYIYPLRVLKEIAAMFFSVNDVAFRNCHMAEVRRAGPELAQVVLSRDRRCTLPPFRFFVYFTTSAPMRSIGWALKVSDGSTTNLSEITFPPFGYVMTADGDPPHRDMEEITSFGLFGYDDFKMVHLRLPVLPVASPFPGDYRTEAEVGAAEETVHEVRDAEGQPTPLRLVHVPARD